MAASHLNAAPRRRARCSRPRVERPFHRADVAEAQLSAARRAQLGVSCAHRFRRARTSGAAAATSLSRRPASAFLGQMSAKPLDSLGRDGHVGPAARRVLRRRVARVAMRGGRVQTLIQHRTLAIAVVGRLLVQSQMRARHAVVALVVREAHLVRVAGARGDLALEPVPAARAPREALDARPDRNRLVRRERVVVLVERGDLAVRARRAAGARLVSTPYC